MRDPALMTDDIVKSLPIRQVEEVLELPAPDAPPAAVAMWVMDVAMAARWRTSRLAKEAGLAPSTVNRFVRDPRGQPRPKADTLQKLADVARTEIYRRINADPFGRVDMGLEIVHEGKKQDEINLRGGHIPAEDLVGNRDLPVFGTAEGGRYGAMSMSSGAQRYVRRPEPLMRVPSGFGIIIVGDSMEPAFEIGDIALVDPTKPPRPGDDVLLIHRDHHQDVHALIKRLVGVSADEWQVRQWNPREDFALPRSEWREAQVVVGSYKRP